MKIVVVGATGHIGHYAVHRLASSGHDVVALSRSGSVPGAPFGAPPLSGRIVAESVDIASDGCVEAIARHLGPEVALVQLAAWHPPATGATIAEDRRTLIEVNVLGTMRVLDAARKTRAGARAVVYVSSFEVYGETTGGGLTEESRVSPLTDYGATKLSGEDHLISWAAEEGSRVVALRMPAVYGPGETTPRALPLFLQSVAKGVPPTILGDGGDLRDQLHARDAAVAIERALIASASGIFNVADGERHSITSLARAAMAAAGLPGEPTVKPRVKPRRDYHMSIARARRELGFAPSVPIADGIREQLAWLRSRASA